MTLLFFHPVFNPQAGDTTEMLGIVGHKNKIIIPGSCSNKQVETVYGFSIAFQFMPYVCIFAKDARYFVVLKEPLNRYDIIKVLFFARLNSTKKHFSNGYFGNLQIQMVMLANVLTNILMSLHHCNTNICIEQVYSFCKHRYQTSTVLLFTRPRLRSSAISSAVPSPPQSGLKLAKTSSYSSWFSFSQSYAGADKNAFLLASFSFSSSSICLVRFSVSQRRSPKSIPLSKVNRPSIDIVPVNIIVLFLQFRCKVKHNFRINK